LSGSGVPIRWAAQPTGESLGGRYDVMDQDGYRIQGGRWSTQLTSGARIGTPQRGPDSEARATPDGLWEGTWAGNRYTYAFEMRVDVVSANQIRGYIVWTLRSSPDPGDSTRVGLVATQYIRGSYDPERRTLRLSGYATDDPDEIIDMDRYRLSLSANGTALEGTSGSPPQDGRMSATRTP
ncbi:MAG: hypothetical protein ACREN5_03515, partial [Gemmatimonadales bacterium]